MAVALAAAGAASAVFPHHQDFCSRCTPFPMAKLKVSCGESKTPGHQQIYVHDSKSRAVATIALSQRKPLARDCRAMHGRGRRIGLSRLGSPPFATKASNNVWRNLLARRRAGPLLIGRIEPAMLMLIIGISLPHSHHDEHLMEVGLIHPPSASRPSSSGTLCRARLPSCLADLAQHLLGMLAEPR
jgi:hypothetical protein